MSSENIADRRARLREDPIGSTVGIDPHKKTLTAAVVDYRGGLVAVEHFRVSGDGHRQLEAWALSFGRVARWGVEGVSGWGRHTGVFLAGRGHDVRDVCPNRTNRRDRARQRGKSDALDCERVARETLAHPFLPRAFKRTGPDAGPDEQRELLALWHGARRSLPREPSAPRQRGRVATGRAALGAARPAARHPGGAPPPDRAGHAHPR